jgi:hypothetical protein
LKDIRHESSRGGAPGPGPEEIRARLPATNSAGDLINPPEARILEREIKRLRQKGAVVIPFQHSFYAGMGI